MAEAGTTPGGKHVCDDIHHWNTPSEDERAAEFWENVDREIFGPDYKKILEAHYMWVNEQRDAPFECTAPRDRDKDTRSQFDIDDDVDIGELAAQFEAEHAARTSSTAPRGNTPLSIKTKLAADAIADFHSRDFHSRSVTKRNSSSSAESSGSSRGKTEETTIKKTKNASKMKSKAQQQRPQCRSRADS